MLDFLYILLRNVIIFPQIWTFYIFFISLFIFIVLKSVFVISIPDWGVTPFAKQDPRKRTQEQISSEIDAFNKINLQEANMHEVNYIEITEDSREAKNDLLLLTSDELHPSGISPR